MRKLTKLNQYVCGSSLRFCLYGCRSIERCKTSVDIADNLANLKNFVGVTGKMTIDKDHNPIKAALMVKRDNGEEVSAEAVEIEK